MSRITCAAILTSSVCFAPVAAFASLANPCVPVSPGSGILTGLADQFSTTTGSWLTTALAYAQHLFLLLVAIEIAWSGITYVLQKDSLPDFIASLLLKILTVGFFYTLLQPQYGPAWIGSIVASFMQAGSAISGQPTFTNSDPSSIFACGTDIAGTMLHSLWENNTQLGLGSIVPAIIAVFAALVCALGVVIAFSIVAGQLLIALIESYIVIGGGAFFLGFMGSRWTLVFGEKYIGYAVSVGIKLFMLELIVGLGYGLGRQWCALFGNGVVQPGVYLEVVGAALIFCLLAWQIPGVASSLMNGQPAMSFATAVSAAGQAAVAASVVTGLPMPPKESAGSSEREKKSDDVQAATAHAKARDTEVNVATRTESPMQGESGGRAEPRNSPNGRNSDPMVDAFADEPEDASASAAAMDDEPADAHDADGMSPSRGDHGEQLAYGSARAPAAAGEAARDSDASRGDGGQSSQNERDQRVGSAEHSSQLDLMTDAHSEPEDEPKGAESPDVRIRFNKPEQEKGIDEDEKA